MPLVLGHRLRDRARSPAPDRPNRGCFGLEGSANVCFHADPRTGVVDEHCRVHSVDNLYIAGSSVFTTGGYANPTFTLLALALRLADTLRSRLGADRAGVVTR
jgi:hypothetical protein